MLCLHPCYCYLLCRVNRIVRLSRCRAKTIKVRSEEKANYFINEQKVGKLFKMWKHSAFCQKRNGCQTFVTVRSCFIDCVARRFEGLAYTQIYTAISVVEPRRLLLSTGKIDQLYALYSSLIYNDQLVLQYKEIFTCICRFLEC